MVWLSMAALAAPIGFDRLDVLSEGSPTWIHHEAPRLMTTERFVSARFVEQVEPVLFLPVEGLTVGISMRAIRLHWERPLPGTDTLFVGGGVLTSLLLPTGAQIGAAWRPGRLRVGLSVCALSSASWSRREWTVWHVLPAIGLGFGRDLRPRAIWM
jgi:hypothetical protein